LTSHRLERRRRRSAQKGRSNDLPSDPGKSREEINPSTECGKNKGEIKNRVSPHM